MSDSEDRSNPTPQAIEAVRRFQSLIKRPGRARFLKDRAAIERAVEQGDYGALVALSAAIDPGKYKDVVQAFEHPELPPGSLRYELKATGDSYVIPTAVALAQAVDIVQHSGRVTPVLELHRELLKKSGV